MNNMIAYKKNKKYGSKDVYHIYNTFILPEPVEKVNISINNHSCDTETNSVCLNLMMIPNESSYLNDMVISLQKFNYIFENIFIVIDSPDKNLDAYIEPDIITEFVKQLKDKNVISEKCIINTHLLSYKSKATEYKDLIYNIFNYQNPDEINIKDTYKNAFAYYYSLYNSPTKYMFHIDMTKPSRLKYGNSNNKNDTNFILQCIQLLKTKDKTVIVGLIGPFEEYIENAYYEHEYQTFHSNQPNVSLQCFVADTERWKPKTRKYTKTLYKQQTEIAITKTVNETGNTTLALFGYDTNVEKMEYDWPNNALDYLNQDVRYKSFFRGKNKIFEIEN